MDIQHLFQALQQKSKDCQAAIRELVQVRQREKALVAKIDVLTAEIDIIHNKIDKAAENGLSGHNQG